VVDDAEVQQVRAVGRGFSVEQQDLIWDLYRRGESIREIERVVGETLPRIRRFLRDCGGIRPVPRRRRVGHLTAAEREEISRGIAAGESGRLIAGRLGRSASTVAREIARNDGRDGYRAAAADAAAYVRARRPKEPMLAGEPGLRAVVLEKLEEQWSPQQISAWLRRCYPGDPRMRVSHETIYRCIYVTSRKVFDSRVFHELRTGRSIRRVRVRNEQMPPWHPDERQRPVDPIPDRAHALHTEDRSVDPVLA
jgi:IS30 family transposase